MEEKIISSLAEHEYTTGIRLPISLDYIVAFELSGYIVDLISGTVLPDPDQEQQPIDINTYRLATQ